MKIGVVGAGVFGLAAAIELATRGHQISVFDQGVVPYPNATSTDVSKAIRRTWYAGDNQTYVELVERSAPQWRDWEKGSGQSFYHQTGGLNVTTRFGPGEPLTESVEFLRDRGADITVMSADEACGRFPQFRFADDEVCVHDRWSGYIESGRAVNVMADVARSTGVHVHENTPVKEIEEGNSLVTMHFNIGSVEVDLVVVAVGAWVGQLLPELGEKVWVTRQEMLLIEPRQPEMFAHGIFPVWGVDPDGEGWYGFPLLREGYVKIAKEPLGDTVDPNIDRTGTKEFAEQALAFLRDRIPEMAHGTVVEGRSCLYTVTPDDHFMIDRVPGRERVFVAGGGSGHGFKFGGSIGPVIADVVEDTHNPLGDRFKIGHRFDSTAQPRPEHSRGFAKPR